MFQGSSVALVTPMKKDANGQTAIDLDAFDQLLQWHAESGTQAVVVAGTTGESATLDHEEYVQLLTRATERLQGKVMVIAGTGSPSTAHSIHRTRLAASLGAEAALVVTPSYNRPSQRGLMAHYHAIADASEIPVILYNVPGRTAVDLLPETSLALARHPNIVAIKEAVADAQRIAALIDGGLTVYSGDDPTFVRSMRQGAKGVISVASNIAPKAMARLCDLVQSGEYDKAEALDAQLQALYGFLGVESNPVPAKWLLAKMGRMDEAIRLPLVDLDSSYHDQANALIQTLKSTDIL